MANNLVVQLLLKTGTFSQDLKQAGGQVKQFRKGCSDAGDVVSAFSKSLGVNIGAIKKFAPAAAAAAAAGKILKDSFKQNTDAMDAFNREAEVVKSTYRSLTSQLFKTGNMSFDFKGIAEQAREYYNAMDSANVANMAITNELKLQQVEYDRLYAVAMDVSLGEVDRLEALNQASVVLENQIKLKKQLAQFDKNAAKETLENRIVGSGVNKRWLENEGQQVLKDLMEYDEANGQYMFDTFYNSIKTTNANTGVLGHGGIYDRTITKMGTPKGAKSVEEEAKRSGKDLNTYLEDLKQQQIESTKTINSAKYQLAQALHNIRVDEKGREEISKYILLYLNDYGIEDVDAQAQATRAMIERLRKRIKGGRGSGSGKTTDEEKFLEGSIGYLEKELEQKKKDLISATTQAARDALIKDIKGLEETINVMSGKSVELTKGSEEWLKSEINNLTDQMSKLDIGLPDTTELILKMNDWEKSWEEFVESLTDEERELFNQFAEAMKSRWDMMNKKSVYETALSASQGKTTPKKTEYLEGSYGAKKQELNTNIENTKKGLVEGVNLTEEDIKKKLAELKRLQAELDALDEKFGFKSIDKSTDQWKEFNDAMANTSTIVSNLAETFQEGTKVTAASILRLVSTSLPALSSLITAFAALAGVEAAEKAVQTSKHWIEAIAAVAALGAAVATAISSAKSQKFANGGIVGGSSFTGDRVTAQVNSGEMILNKTQQANLFKMANSGVGGGGQVEFHISGTELVGVLNNQNRKNKLIR